MIEVEFNGRLQQQITIEAFNASVPKNVIMYLSKLHSRNMGKLVYTSFNGDYIGYIENMVYDALRSGYVPINPECALDYYLSTVSFNNSKVKTMLACISLVLLCDEFWVYIDDQDDIYDLPEGVIAEMYAWYKLKDRESKVIIRESKKYVHMLNGVASVRGERVRSIKEIVPTINQIEVSKFINGIDKGIINNIKDTLIDKFETSRMKCKYISYDFRDEKHKDWARKFCYDNSEVALIANSLINPFIIDLASDDDYYEKYLFLRTQILKKSDEVVFFFKPADLKSDKLNLTIDVINDLYFCLTNNIKFSFMSWQDVGVPKYCNVNWAITEKERKLTNPQLETSIGH